MKKITFSHRKFTKYVNSKKLLIITSTIFFATCFAFSQGKGKNNNDAGGSGIIKNNGQLIDINGNPTPTILYYTSAGGADLYFTKNSVCYVWSRGDTSGTTPDTLYRMDMQFLGTNSMVQVSGEEQLQEYSNFYLAHAPSGIPNVPSYQKLIYKDVYPNIDLVFNNDSRGLNYDFIIHTGGNIDDIKFKYAGSDLVEINPKGELHARNPMGNIRQERPSACENLKICPVPERAIFIIKGKEISISLTSPVRPKPNVKLIISIVPIKLRPPILINGASNIRLSWSTYYGANSWDQFRDMVLDNSGNLYSTGQAFGNNFPVTIGSATPLTSDYDAYIIKFNNDGSLAWATLIGGEVAVGTGLEGDDFANGIAVNSSGDVYIAGYTNSVDFPVTPDGSAYYQSTIVTTDDAFIAKFNSAGTLQWATYYGGSVTDQALDVAIDGADNIYMTGGSDGGGFPMLDPGTGAHFQNTPNGPFLVKFDLNGVRIVSTFFSGTTAGGNGRTISIDGSDNVYLTGEISASGLNTPNPGTAYNQTSPVGLRDGFIAKFNSSGFLQWGTYFGGSDEDFIKNTTIDPFGNFYIAGFLNNPSTSFPLVNPGGGAYYQDVASGVYEGFIAKFNTNGALIWSTYYGGNDEDLIDGITTDDDGNLYVAGWSYSTNLPKNPETFQRNNNGSSDAFIAGFTPSNKLFLATYFGGTQDDVGFRIEAQGVPLTGSLYIGGYTGSSQSQQFPLLQDPSAYYDGTFGGGIHDLFVAKFEWSCRYCQRIASPDLPEEVLNNTESKVTFYPNPFSDILKIRINLPEEQNIILKIYNTIGILVFSQKIDVAHGTNVMDIDFSNLSKGLYIIQTTIGNKTIYDKIINY